MKVQTGIVLFLCAVFLGCVTSKKNNQVAQIPEPPNKILEKSCEDIFAEEVATKWNVVDGKTIYPGFVRNDSFISRLIGDLKPCLIGKSQDFIIFNLGQSSRPQPGSIRYDCYPNGETKLDSSTCLIFQLDKDFKVSDVQFRKCRARQ
jgi:hypothetical protein